MDDLMDKLRAFWEWVRIPWWKFYAPLAAAFVLWVVRQFALSRLVLMVALVAWVVGFTVSRTDMAQGFGAQALNFAVLGGGALAVILFWFLLIRKG